MNKTTQEEKALGALISIPDNRQIPMSSVLPKVTIPDYYRADDNGIPVENQKDKGTCVGQAEGGEIEYREYKDTGVVTPLSKRWLYAECKKIDGYSGEGTYPNVCAGIKVKRGTPKKSFCVDNNDLSYAEYLKISDNTKEIDDDASLRVASGYLGINDIEDVMQAIYQKGTFTATLIVGDWSQCPVKPTPNRGAHRVRFNGYEKLANGDVKIWFRNSWGLNWAQGVDEYGNGWFLWSDYKLNVYEMLVYTDVPTALIEKARATPYKFTRTLKYKMTGTDVTELQKRLSNEKGLDGLPCYAYKQNGEIYFSNFFGLETQKALQKYQTVKNIVSSGTPETTGFGQLGPTTRAVLNGGVLPKTTLLPKVEVMKNNLVKIMASIGKPIVITDEYRSIEEQNELYAQGRTKPGNIVTNARGGESFHNWRVAFDIAFSTKTGISYDGDWEMVGTIGEILGLEWGGWSTKATQDTLMIPGWPGFIDKPHFQFTAGYTIQDFQKGVVDLKKFEV
jgi:peptidoglycan L-alanyl-D-glutamate endopeptidase CwlK